MEPADFDQRLSRITTLWTLHVRAHSPDAAAAARGDLLYRYRAAAYRYMLAAVRDVDAADDLAQEFAVRFLRGDFRHADPGRGRFRDYLRTALRHLVTDHHRAKQREPAPLAVEPAATPGDADETFHTAWREELLERAWQGLAAEQATGHAVLRLRVEEPDDLRADGGAADGKARAAAERGGGPQGAAARARAIRGVAARRDRGDPGPTYGRGP